MKNILIIIAALLGIGAFGQTNIPTRQMMADMNGVVKWPTNITSITIGGRTYTNLLGFGLALTNGQLSIDTTQLPSGGGGGGSGTVTSVGLSTSLSGLSVGSSPVTSSGTITLSGTLGLGSGGTGATDAPGARTALSLVPGTDVQAYDSDLAAIAALANSGIIVRTGSGTVSARTITGDSEAVVSNGDGVSGNPTLSIGAAIARDSEVAAGYQPLDADLTTLATLNGASLTNLNGTEIRSGTVADARIDSAIARDSEVSAAYQPLDADLTAMAAGTAVATAQTNSVSLGAPIVYAGSTNLPEHIALKAPLASPALTGSPTVPDDPYDSTGWNGSTGIPTKNAVRDKIESLSSGSGDVVASGNNTLSGTNTFSGPTWIKPNRKRVVLFEKEWNGLTSGNMGYPEFNGTALASGSATIIAGETNHQGMVRLTSSSSANSGYYYISSTSGLFAEPLLTWESISRVRGTNAGISSTHGFTDSVNSSNPTDAIRMWRSNNFLIPQIWNNGSLVQGYEYPVSSNQVLYIKVQVQTNMTDVSFYSEDSDTKTLVVSTNLTGTIPASSSRVFGMGHFAFFTNAVAIGIEDLDWSTAYIDTPVNR